MDISYSEIKYSYKSLSELNECYLNYKEKEMQIDIYPTELVIIREDIINWLEFLCQNLNFRKETLFRSIELYDLYISKVYNTNIGSMDQIKLTAIACLSLSTKLEEINCNFVKFLTEKVLNGNKGKSNQEEIFTTKDLINKEFGILKELNFRTNQSTSFQYLTIFHQICFNLLGNTQQFNYIVNLSEQVLLNNTKNYQLFLMSSKDIALFSFTQSLNILQKYDINKIIIYNIYVQISKIFNCVNSFSKLQKTYIPLINYSCIQNM